MAKKEFYIARIDGDFAKKKVEVETSTEETKKFEPERFVSSYFGKKVKDTPSFPYIKYGNSGSQYEGLRDERKTSEEELIERYGTKFYEFKQIQGIKDGPNQEESLRSRPNNDDRVNPNGDYSPRDKEIPSYLRREPYNNTKENNSKGYEPIIDEVDVEEYSKEPYLEPYQNRNMQDDKSKINEYDFFEKTTYSRKPDNKPKDSNNYQEPSYQESQKRSLGSGALARSESSKRPVDTVRSEPEKSESKTFINYDDKFLKSSPLLKGKKPLKYKIPPLNLFKRGETQRVSDYSSVNFQKEVIDKTLKDFKVGGRVVHYTKGPTVTQFEVKLDPGVKVERVKNLSKNLQMNLEGKSIRIEAPIPGKATIGIEVPNIVQDKVMFGDLISRDEFLKDGNPLNVVLGIDISGDFITLDITSMPHALIAGTTGSGKSVCINTIITSIIFKSTPEQVRLILIDPKLIEFSSYEDIPHLATPVINDPKLATTALKWAVDEMQNRYQLFKAYKRRDITSFNEYARSVGNVEEIPYIVIIIDELADLMFIAASTVEEYIQRLAQKARAAGIHLIMATQRPSTDVIKGSIKANIQTRIAFQVNSQVDSMTILDRSGADKLLGKGDMLYNDGVTETRVQGAFISLDEINNVTDHIRLNNGVDFMFSREDLEQKMDREENQEMDPRDDEYFPVVANFVVENDNASINRIQKKFGIGFNRAQSIMLGLEELGIVSDGVAGKQRSVLVTADELESILND